MYRKAAGCFSWVFVVFFIFQRNKQSEWNSYDSHASAVFIAVVQAGPAQPARDGVKTQSWHKRNEIKKPIARRIFFLR